MCVLNFFSVFSPALAHSGSSKNANIFRIAGAPLVVYVCHCACQLVRRAERKQQQQDEANTQPTKSTVQWCYCFGCLLMCERFSASRRRLGAARCEHNDIGVGGGQPGPHQYNKRYSYTPRPCRHVHGKHNKYVVVFCVQIAATCSPRECAPHHNAQLEREKAGGLRRPPHNT